MLEKEVIKYTRDGIQKQNLATGATEMLTQSDFAKQLHYNRPGVSRYSRKHPDKLSEKQIHLGPLSRTYSKKESVKSVISFSPDTGDKMENDAIDMVRPAAYKKIGDQEINKAIIPHSISSLSTQSAQQRVPFISIPYWQRTKNTVGRDQIQRFGRYLIRDVSRELKESDSVGLQAAGEYTQDVQSAVQAFQDVRRFARRKGYRIKDKPSPPDEMRAAAARNAAARRIAYQKTKAIPAPSETASFPHTILKAIFQGAKDLIVGSGTKVFLVAAVLIVMSITGLNQSTGAFANSFIGSTIDHPELTEYVAQLDQDFQQEVNDEKEKYSDKPNTTVKIEWNGFVDTDANVLAILVTKDWTVLDLNSENRAALKKFHSALNTYTVEKKSDIEQTVTDNGEVKEESTRKITIRVHLYTAEEIIDSLGFTGTEKNHILEMLDVLKQITDSSSPTTGIIITDGDGLFTWPTPGVTTITSPFGARWGKVHKGIDISGYEAYGKVIVATADGVVTQAVHSGWGGGYGLCVYIDHSNGYSSRYGHCSKVLVNKGDHVQKGQIIAYIGSSGDSTGPHLHFEIRKNGVPINPQPFFK